MFRPISLACLLALGACENSSSSIVFDVRIVDAAGGNPALGTDIDTLNITLQQGTADAEVFAFPVVDGLFDVGVFLDSLVASTGLRAELTGPTSLWFGAPPRFIPTELLLPMTVVVGEPNTCGRIDGLRLGTSRQALGTSLYETFAFVAGGSEADPQVEFVDLLSQEPGTFDVELDPLGATQVADIGDGQVLVVSAQAGPFIFDLSNPDDRATPVALHAGAGLASALASVAGKGAYVIGGDDDGTPTDVISIVGLDGTVEERTLSTPRLGAAAVAVGDSVLVVGGDAAGSAEVISPSGIATTIDGFADGVREFALLLTDDGATALLVGGLDASAEVRSNTWLFADCPDPCTPSAGPDWLNPRAGAITPTGSALIVGGEGSRLVERVDFVSGSASISTMAELELPRSQPGAIELESGVLIVLAGNDGAGPRDDVEYCFPAALNPL